MESCKLYYDLVISLRTWKSPGRLILSVSIPGHLYVYDGLARFVCFVHFVVGVHKANHESHEHHETKKAERKA